MSSNRHLTISVVIPTRDRPALLGDCIKSLLSQAYPPEAFDLIVVDDGTTGAAAETVESINSSVDGAPKVVYTRSARGGPSAARNSGLRLATGELIALIDDDVLAPSNWLRELATGRVNNPQADCFVGRIVLRAEGKAPRVCGRELLGESELDLGDRELEVHPDRLISANMAVSRRALSLAGYFDENLPIYGEETEWAHRLQWAGGKLMYLPSAWVWHRRPAEELRLRRLLVRRFKRGRSWARLAPYIKREVTVVQSAWRVLPSLGHAVRRRCTVGLLEAVFWMGCCVQAASMWLRHGGRPFIRWSPERALTKAGKRLFRTRGGSEGP